MPALIALFWSASPIFPVSKFHSFCLTPAAAALRPTPRSAVRRLGPRSDARALILLLFEQAEEPDRTSEAKPARALVRAPAHRHQTGTRAAAMLALRTATVCSAQKGAEVSSQ